jgi:DNA gyrase subunit A
MFFSSGGKVYREKVWRLPEAGPAAKGRALVNLLPDLGGDNITAVLPLPQDEGLWESLHLVFATASGHVRRNRLSDFRNIRSSGMIAMKLDEGDSLIGVATCREGQDVFLATKGARCIRFQITDDTLRVFAGRGSSGVRGIRLASGDRVISLAVLNHVEATVEERSAYLRMANARRRAENAAEAAEEAGDEADLPITAEEGEDEAVSETAVLSPERFAQLEAAEEILLVVSDGGFGRRSSAYDYRVSGRGGQGITNMTFSASKKGTEVAATLPVLAGTDVMLVTDGGRLIRVPVDQVRVMSRQASGVTVLRLNDSERVTSVFPVMDDGDDEGGDDSAQESGADSGA